MDGRKEGARAGPEVVLLTSDTVSKSGTLCSDRGFPKTGRDDGNGVFRKQMVMLSVEKNRRDELNR